MLTASNKQRLIVYPTLNFDTMKKDLQELTIEEFVRVLTGEPTTIYLPDFLFECLAEEYVVKQGSYRELLNYYRNLEQESDYYKPICEVVEYIENNYLDYDSYCCGLSKVEIYNWLKNKTDNFNNDLSYMLLLDIIGTYDNIFVFLTVKSCYDVDLRCACKILEDKIGLENQSENLFKKIRDVVKCRNTIVATAEVLDKDELQQYFDGGLISVYEKFYYKPKTADAASTQQAAPAVRPLPEILNTDKGRELLQRTINGGFCDEAFKWLKSKSLLAYYADKANDYLEIRKGEYDGREKTSWKPFETLFNVKGLAGARNDYQKTGTLPDGSTDIDRLFD